MSIDTRLDPVNCPICYDSIGPNDATARHSIVTRTGEVFHAFHKDCITRAAQAAREAGSQAACPICRSDVSVFGAEFAEPADRSDAISALAENWNQEDGLRLATEALNYNEAYMLFDAAATHFDVDVIEALCQRHQIRPNAINIVLSNFLSYLQLNSLNLSSIRNIRRLYALAPIGAHSAVGTLHALFKISTQSSNQEVRRDSAEFAYELIGTDRLHLAAWNVWTAVARRDHPTLETLLSDMALTESALRYALEEAIKLPDFRSVSSLLQNGNITEGTIGSAIFAVYEHWQDVGSLPRSIRIDMIKTVLQHKPAHVGFLGNYFIYHAASKGDAELLEALLPNDASSDHLEEYLVAARNGHAECIRVLISKAPLSINQKVSVIKEAVQHGNYHVLKKFLPSRALMAATLMGGLAALTCSAIQIYESQHKDS